MSYYKLSEEDTKRIEITPTIVGKGWDNKTQIRQEFYFTKGRIMVRGKEVTRATAVFTIKYLYTLGFKTNNDLFEKHSKYFRNALVRANYQNLEKDIPYTMEYLNKFFGNLLLGENNLLDNREMQIKDISTQKSPNSTQKTTQKILDVLRIDPKASRKELAERLNTTEDSIKWHLETLKKENKIRRIGAAKGGYWEVL